MRCVVGLAVALSGCVSPPNDIECNVARDASGRAIVTPDLLAEEAAYVANKADTLAARLAASPGLAGFQGGITRRFLGTESYSFAVELNQLRSLVARQKAQELALVNDGDTLLGTTKEWQCETFANSIASLDQGQSSEQLAGNLEMIRDRLQGLATVSREAKGR